MAKILVIDDESNIRMMLKLALAHVGHQVETAADGYEGLELYGDGTAWDLVLLDQRMPGLEGLEVLREIRHRVASAKIIMITAFGTIDLATEAMTVGATDFLRKPFTVDTLRSAVTAALRGWKEGTGEKETSPIPYSFDTTTVNGYRLHSLPGVEMVKDGGISDLFTVTTTTGEERKVRVVLPCYVAELVKAHADLEEMPGDERFWQALCGEALANYLWQNAELPENDTLTIDDLTSGLRHWIDAVLSATGK
jgi:CheY-like chemotaxis protein